MLLQIILSFVLILLCFDGTRAVSRDDRVGQSAASAILRVEAQPQLSNGNSSTDVVNYASNAFSEIITGRPLFINLGQGTTGTHGIHDAMCKNGLRACHFYLVCPGNKLSQVQPHRHLVELQLSAHLCIDKSASTGKLRDRFRRRRLNCDALSWLRKYQGAVDSLIKNLLSNRLDGYSDTPVTGIIRHVLAQLPSYTASADSSGGLVGREVKFILTTRDSDVWAQRRIQGHGFVLTCRHNTSVVTGRVSNPLSDYIECVSAAQLKLNVSSFQLSDAFENIKKLPVRRLTKIMEDYQTSYVYEVMRHYLAAQNDSLEMGRNFLHVNYFNTSVNFVNMTTAEIVEQTIRSFLRGNQIR